MSFLNKFLSKDKRDKIFLKIKKTKLQDIKDEKDVQEFEKTKIFLNKEKVKEVQDPLPATLSIVFGANKDSVISVGSARINIGRMSDNEVSLLDDTGVSRLHAFIVSENGRHVIYDGKSMNGTYINNIIVTKKILQHGDLIKLGNTVLLYELQ